MNIALNPLGGLGDAWLHLTRSPGVFRRMPATADHPRGVRRGTTLTVLHPVGCEIICCEGTLWITHDGDPRDLVLERGQCYVAERGSKMLVHALEDSSLRLTHSSVAA